MIAKNGGQLVSIQLLRAIAALCVVYLHSAMYTFPEISFGGFGVDIFFVISGFIIAFVVSKNTKKFLLRRIIRVVPLYWLVTILTILLCLLFPRWFNQTSVSVSGAIKSLLFIPYKTGTSGPIVLLGWTLNFEMFFYLIMALCVLCIKNKKHLTAAAVSVLVFFIVFLNLVKSEKYIIEFYKDRALLEFIYGIVLFHIYIIYRGRHGGQALENKKASHTPPPPPPVGIRILFLAVGLCSFLFLAVSDIYEFDILTKTIQIGIPALLLVLSILFLENSLSQNNIFIRIGQKLGDASYVMYLFHPFFIYFLQRLVYPKIFSGSGHLMGKLTQIMIGMIITSIGSIFLYNYVDKPLQKKLGSLVKMSR